MKVYKIYLRLLDLLEKTILVCAFSSMLFITFMNILDRKIPILLAWSTYEELTCALFLLVTLVGAAMAARRGRHLGLSIVTDLFPKRAQPFLGILGGACGIVFSVLLVMFGYEMVQGEILMNMRTPALGWPEWVFGAFIPLGGFFMTLEFFNHIIFSFTKESPVWRE